MALLCSSSSKRFSQPQIHASPLVLRTTPLLALISTFFFLLLVRPVEGQDLLSSILGVGASKRKPSKPPSYAVCGSAPEQLLYHASHIAALHLGIIEDDNRKTNHNNNLQPHQQDYEVEEEEADDENDQNVNEAADEFDVLANQTMEELQQQEKDESWSLFNTNKVRAFWRRRPLIRIPNVFIYDTTQQPSDSTAAQQHLLPTSNNSVPLSRVLDTGAFVTSLRRELRIRVQLDRSVSDDALFHDTSYYNVTLAGQTSCQDLYHVVGLVSSYASQQRKQHQSKRKIRDGAQLMLDILDRMLPGDVTDEWTDFILKELPGSNHHANGICIHSPEAVDERQWQATCDQWTPYLTASKRGLSNCHLPSSSTYIQPENAFHETGYDLVMKSAALYEQLRSRGLIRKRFGYFVGENDAQGPHPLPFSLEHTATNEIVGHVSFWNSTRRIKPQTLLGMDAKEAEALLLSLAEESTTAAAETDGAQADNNQVAVAVSSPTALHRTNGRDNAQFWNLVDFFVCREMKFFVGHSVSLFGALQIASRKSQQSSYWYNSGSIPLGQIWKGVFGVPFVLTYTELSSTLVKHHFMATIFSLRHHMPDAIVNVMYHRDENGFEDKALLKWLEFKSVQVLDHEPTWKEKLDQWYKEKDQELAEKGDIDNELSSTKTSRGDHFGSWQRLDVPIYIDTEYAFFVDASNGALFQKPIDLVGSGLDLPRKLSLTADRNQEPDASVLLLNVPYMRKTYRQFSEEVLDGNFGALRGRDNMYPQVYAGHVESLPSVYGSQPLESDAQLEKAALIRFDGPSPIEYIRAILLQPCSEANEFLCEQGLDERDTNGVCRSLSLFSQHMESYNRYCYEAFDDEEEESIAKQKFCSLLLENLAPSKKTGAAAAGATATKEVDPCLNFAKVIQKSLESLPPRAKLHNKKEIAQKFGFWVDPLAPKDRTAPPAYLLLSSLATSMVGGMLIVYLLFRTYRQRGARRKSRKRLLLTATIAWLLLSFVLLPMMWTTLL